MLAQRAIGGYRKRLGGGHGYAERLYYFLNESRIFPNGAFRH
jgi:hypothetical protein